MVEIPLLMQYGYKFIGLFLSLLPVTFACCSCEDNSCFSFFILKKEELSDFCSDAKAKAKAKGRAKGKS
jgi:hypothetical protein